jgi:cell division protein FtsW
MDFRAFSRLIFHLAIPVALILFEPDNGTTAMLLALLCVLFFICRVSWKFWALPLCCLALIGGAIGSQMSHVADRLRIYLHPELDLLGKGHQPYQAKIAAGSGRLGGRGLGESLQKLNYLPEARSDYIAAIFAEEFGFIGITTLILIYMGFSFFGFRAASEAQEQRIAQLAALLTFSIAFQAFVNLGVVSGLLPSKGTNLPFFSQGGSSLLSNMAALGIVLRSTRPKYTLIASDQYGKKAR